MPAGATAAAVVGVVAAVVAIADALDNAVKSGNVNKANSLKHKLDSILNSSNLKLSRIQNALTKAGADYQLLMDNLQFVSRAGKAYDQKNKLTKRYSDLQSQYKKDADEIQNVVTGAMQMYQPEIDKLSNKGLWDTIGEYGDKAINSMSNIFGGNK